MEGQGLTWAEDSCQESGEEEYSCVSHIGLISPCNRNYWGGVGVLFSCFFISASGQSRQNWRLKADWRPTEVESKENHGVWDPMPELTITSRSSPYIHFSVDSNTCTMGNPKPESTLTLCQSRLYPPVRDFGFGLCYRTWVVFEIILTVWEKTTLEGVLLHTTIYYWCNNMFSWRVAVTAREKSTEYLMYQWFILLLTQDK